MHHALVTGPLPTRLPPKLLTSLEDRKNHVEWVTVVRVATDTGMTMCSWETSSGQNHGSFQNQCSEASWMPTCRLQAERDLSSELTGTRWAYFASPSPFSFNIIGHWARWRTPERLKESDFPGCSGGANSLANKPVHLCTWVSIFLCQSEGASALTGLMR